MTEVLPQTDSSVVAAARQLQVSWQPERSEHNLARIHARRARRSLGYRASAGAALVLAAAALFVVVSGRKAALPRQPAQAVPSVVVAAVKSPKTTFVDGSVARVSAGGELVVKLATAQRIESVLAAGAADFEVTKHPERDFVVVAGAVQVRVVGTHFRVERSGERTRVSVSEGKVEVQEGALLSYLEAGESRFFPSVPEQAKDEPHGAASSGAHERFLALARGRDFKAAYQLLSQSPAALGSSAEDLMLAADAARLSNHPEQALGYLRRVTTEHAADSRAPMAAFTLGRVLLSQLSRPAEAADAFALARRLRPGGSLAEDALAREAEARAAAGSSGEARSLAEQYVSRYPAGKHLPTMQRLATAK